MPSLPTKSAVRLVTSSSFLVRRDTSRVPELGAKAVSLDRCHYHYDERRTMNHAQKDEFNGVLSELQE